jgi:hypothetical protein
VAKEISLGKAASTAQFALDLIKSSAEVKVDSKAKCFAISNFVKVMRAVRGREWTITWYGMPRGTTEPGWRTHDGEQAAFIAVAFYAHFRLREGCNAVMAGRRAAAKRRTKRRSRGN